MAKAKDRVESIAKSAILKVGQVVEINQAKHKGQKFIIDGSFNLGDLFAVLILYKKECGLILHLSGQVFLQVH